MRMYISSILVAYSYDYVSYLLQFLLHKLFKGKISIYLTLGFDASLENPLEDMTKITTLTKELSLTKISECYNFCKEKDFKVTT